MPRPNHYVKLQRYDSRNSVPAWEDVDYIPARQIVSLDCSFLEYGVEQSATVVVKASGSFDSSIDGDQPLAAARASDALYRLTVYCDDVNFTALDYPSTWRDRMIYWSGMVDDVEQGPDRVTITAVGWTQHLARIGRWLSTSEQSYAGTSTIATAVGTLFTSHISGQWPGTISNQADTEGTITEITLGEKFGAGAGPFSALDTLQEFASRGGFFFGVACSGYPLHSSDEFRLVFREPRTILEDTGSVTENVHWTYGREIPTTLRAAETQDNLDFTSDFYVKGKGVDVEFLFTMYRFIGPSFGPPVTSTFLSVFQFQIATPYKLPIFNLQGATFSDAWKGLGITDVRDVYRFSVTLEDGEVRGGSGASNPVEFDSDYSGFPRFTRAGYATDPMVIQSAVMGASGVPSECLFTLRDGPYAWTQNGDENYSVSGKYEIGLNPFPDPAATPVCRLVGNGRPLELHICSSESRATRAKTLSQGDLATERDLLFAAQRELWNERLQARGASLIVTGSNALPTGEVDNKVALVDGDKVHALVGEFSQGDDERSIGGRSVYVVRGVTSAFRERGIQHTYDLGAAPRRLSSILLPQSERQVTQ